MHARARPADAYCDLPTHRRTLFRRIAPRRGDRSVIDSHQIQPLWWGDLTARGAVARGERRGEIIGAPLAFPDVHQRTSHRAHLVLQERTRRGADTDLFASARDIEAIERLYRRFGLALGRAEGGEVVMADKALCGGMHRFGIERARHAPSAVLVERKIGAAVDDAIKVMPFDGGEPGVEVRRRAFGGEYHDRLRAQVEIDGVAHGLAFPVLSEIDMRHLAQSMQRGVGPSGGADYNPLAGEGCNRIGEDGLHW